MHTATCPWVYPLTLLSRKWSYLILRALNKGCSFSQLQRELRFITNRILSRELRILQEEKVVSCTKNMYALTRAGTELLVALQPLAHWSVTHKGSQHCSANKQCSTCKTYPEIVKIGTYEKPI